MATMIVDPVTCQMKRNVNKVSYTFSLCNCHAVWSSVKSDICHHMEQCKRVSFDALPHIVRLFLSQVKIKVKISASNSLTGV